MKRYIALLLLLCQLLTLAACQRSPAVPPDSTPGQSEQSGSGNTEQPGNNTGSGNADKPDPPKTITIRLTAVGDNLLHDSVSYTAQKADGSFDYSVLYDQIAPHTAGQ